MAIRELLWTGGLKPAYFTLLGLGILLIPFESKAQVRQSPDLLHQLSNSLEDIAQKVSPAVVQIIVTSYGPMEKEGQSNAALMGYQRVTGSGVIIDPEGYIITNAHVVSGAQRVRVLLASPVMSGSPASVLMSTSRSLSAKIVGVDKEIDIALLKVMATELPALTFAEYQQIRQGEVVLAFGSPEGLENTITMGIISSVARQSLPDHPLAYIQTDAPINQGNSGGPLVDIDGKVVGLNTFILSQSGGSEGIGFAIPSSVVNHAYKQLKQFGHVSRKVVGAVVQPITMAMAEALNLPQDHGIIVADIMPGGPAEAAGLKIQDVVQAVNDRPMQSVSQFATFLFLLDKGDQLKLEVLRGNEKMTLEIPVVERNDEADQLADMVNKDNEISKLGIVGVSIDEKTARMFDGLRINTGIIVAALTEPIAEQEIGLAIGDIIHSVNGVTIQSIEALRDALSRVKSGNAVTLLVERGGHLRLATFRLW
jgi:serine protease Do